MREATPRPQDAPELSANAVHALTRGRIVEAIKLLREERGIGLKEAKQAVDRHLMAHPALRRKIQSQREEALRGCLLWIAVLIALAFIAYFVLASR